MLCSHANMDVTNETRTKSITMQEHSSILGFSFVDEHSAQHSTQLRMSFIPTLSNEMTI
uniref:Uncharacterized protein n=1 Tax=Physcomitrium patens TaxID=3218 RepID=A0A2K1KNN8_PHYPA|nr:hypothetical protein PHYPA_006289 [Physcomitrium patens]